MYLYVCIYIPVLQEARGSASGGKGKPSPVTGREGWGLWGDRLSWEGWLSASPVGLGAPSLSRYSQPIIECDKKIVRVETGGQQAK